MIQKLKNIGAALTLSLIMALTPAAVSAVTIGTSASTLRNQACAGLTQVGDSDCDRGDDGVYNIIQAVVNVLSFIVGFVAVIAIIFSGFRYITAGGDSNKISSAKSTLIYATIGIVVVVLAQVLVNFVFTQTSRAVN